MRTLFTLRHLRHCVGMIRMILVRDELNHTVEALSEEPWSNRHEKTAGGETGVWHVA